VPVVEPDGIVMLARKVTDLDELASLTTKLPLGAGPFSVTVPVAPVPPFTVFGFTETVPRPSGLTVSCTVCWVDPTVAVIVTVCDLVTVVVVTTKIPEFCPGDTVTVAGTVTTELLVDKCTTIPPAGAAPERFTAPEVPLPPTSDD